LLDLGCDIVGFRLQLVLQCTATSSCERALAVAILEREFKHEFQLARWITADDRKTIDQFVAAHHSAIAQDMDGDVVFLARSTFDLDYTGRQDGHISFSDVKDIHAGSKRA
jgi:peptide subunit release factor RF-3